MASLKDKLVEGTSALKVARKPDAVIKQLVARVFSTRNSIHFAHWATKSYAEHEALGYLYTAIVNKVDDIIEVYQGKYGLLSGVSCPASAAPKDICAHVKAEADWLGKNRLSISNGNDAIAALLDELEASYLKVIYKLENLK